MKLQQIFDQLSAGEFSQIAVGGQTPGLINEKNYKVVVAHVNMALIALYRRFHLKEGRISVVLQPDTYVYSLTSDYSVSNQRSQKPVKYIDDAGSVAFKDDIMKITKVFTDRNLELTLNDAGDPWSIMTPSLLTLLVPKEIVTPTDQTPTYLKTDGLNIVYRASHAPIVIPMGLFDPNRVVIDLPPMYLEALLYYVASRVQSPLGLTQEGFASQTYAARYEGACKELERMNLQVDQGTERHHLRRHGWA